MALPTAEQLVEQTIRVQDQATGPLLKMAGAADQLFGGIQNVIGVGGLLAGALSLHSAWESTERYLKSIKEVKELTGATASETDFLFSSARKAGVEYQQMQQTMFQLSRRGAMLTQTMAASHGQVPGLAKKFKNLGVDMTKGPVTALINMSDAVKQGKLDTGELMAQFRIPQGQVNDFKGFLENLDKAKLKAAKSGGLDLVSEDDIADFNKLEDAQHRFHDAWNRVQVLVVSRFLPVVATYAEKFADTIEELVPKAVGMARYLADHMVEIVRWAKVFAAVMTAKKLLAVMGPGGALGGILGQLGGGGGIMSAVGAPVSALGGLVSQVGSVVALLAGALPVLAGIAAAVWTVHRGYKHITESVDGTFERVKQSFDLLEARGQNLLSSLGQLWDTVTGLFGVDGTFSAFVGRMASLGFEKLTAGLDWFVHVLRTAVGYLNEVVEVMAPDIRTGIDMIQGFLKSVVESAVGAFKLVMQKGLELVNWGRRQFFMKELSLDVPDGLKELGRMFSWATQGTQDLWIKHWNKTQGEDKRLAAKITDARHVEEARAARGAEAPDKGPPKVYNDFRGSRFDITQNFAEGFDPDRVAVAFTEDLAAMGERRSQSGFAPAFAVGR